MTYGVIVLIFRPRVKLFQEKNEGPSLLRGPSFFEMPALDSILDFTTTSALRPPDRRSSLDSRQIGLLSPQLAALSRSWALPRCTGLRKAKKPPRLGGETALLSWWAAQGSNLRPAD